MSEPKKSSRPTRAMIQMRQDISGLKWQIVIMSIVFLIAYICLLIEMPDDQTGQVVALKNQVESASNWQNERSHVENSLNVCPSQANSRLNTIEMRLGIKKPSQVIDYFEIR